MDLGSLAIKIARSENLPVLPQVVTAVLKLADDPSAGPKDMERVIERDPAISGKILRVSNSAHYGMGNVTTIARAISLLGVSLMRSLVIGVAYQQIISGKQQAINFDKTEFWRHSLGVAAASKLLAKMRMPERAEDAFGIGMMHDIGYLVMDKFCPNEFDVAVDLAKSQHMSLVQAERQVLGFDHAEVGGILAEKWALPSLMRNGIRFHHEPTMDTSTFDLTCIITLANYLAHTAGLGNNDGCAWEEPDSLVMESVGIGADHFDDIRATVVDEVVRAQEVFAIK